jgi:hypothetical protein
MALLATEAFGENPTNVAARQYMADIHMLSMKPQEGLDSYRGYGGGAAAHGATLALAANDERKFSLVVETMIRSKEFIARVVVEPDKADAKTKPMDQEFVLSDLTPQSIEVARGDDGRVYRVQLYPRIEEFPKPRRLDVDAIRLHEFSFASCPMILNDQTYIGRIAMSSGELASVDVSGLALIEFSLIPFRGAVPAGTLEDGVLDISHESGTSLQIVDVRNGIHRQLLEGGPYQVFVRWSKPSMTDAEYHLHLAETIANVKKQIEAGDLPDGKKLLKRLENAQSSKDVMMFSSRLGPIAPQDRIDSRTR